MDASQMFIQTKQFVKSSDSSSTISTCNADIIKSSLNPAFTSGHDIKKFYENTVGTSALLASGQASTKIKNNVDVPKPKRCLDIKAPASVNSLMKSVERGDIKCVKQIVGRNKGCLKWKDQFGWTPLMVACCAGNLLMVQSLLHWGSDLRVTDRKGNTCRSLAATRGHNHIVRALDQYVEDCRKSVTIDSPTDTQLPSYDASSFFCDVCKQNVENTSRKSHLSSVVHNFHASSKRKMPTLYGIPESNKGFQILVKAGWNKEEGLGPSGEGHKFPPKSIFKQDRAGLGAKRYKARVTHKVEEMERVEKNTFKKQLKIEKIKGQTLERSLRRMLS